MVLPSALSVVTSLKNCSATPPSDAISTLLLSPLALAVVTISPVVTPLELVSQTVSVTLPSVLVAIVSKWLKVLEPLRALCRETDWPLALVVVTSSS